MSARKRFLFWVKTLTCVYTRKSPLPFSANAKAPRGMRFVQFFGQTPLKTAAFMELF